MHFNPFSSFTARQLLLDALAAPARPVEAVVLEMFDKRWERMPLGFGEAAAAWRWANEAIKLGHATQEVSKVGEVVIANVSGIPLVFADLSDEDLDTIFQEVVNETVNDIQEPLSGWRRIWNDLTEFLPTVRQEETVTDGVYAFVSGLLLLAMSPISLLRNILVLAMEAPFSNTAGLLLIFLTVPGILLTQTDVGQAPGAKTVDSSPLDAAMSYLAVVVVLPMLALWRVLLRAILKERDEHLAQRIREACGGQGTVLVILGSLHLAGVSRRLQTSAPEQPDSR
ncbi:Uncharacterized protein SCF082_LOCUS42704 [Durusdinium trenchii]|uniref:Uncharacterized protein n=1 Tax=Durusdinium trenchii TaxID=1381693 RepID=A0ABP0QQN3_9DINO